jgi:putative protein-disulfide isomerase
MPEEPSPDASGWAVDYAQRQPAWMTPPEEGEVRLTLLTDPWSVWCWGWEPVRRAVEHRLPDVSFTPLVGGMFPELPDPQEVGFDIDRFFGNVHRTTGMPVRADATRNPRPESTYPACRHLHAVRLLAPNRERTYLRALREAVYLDGRNVSDPEVAADVAGDVGLDEDAFLEALASGEPEREFQERLGTLHEQDLHSYPTFLVTSEDETAQAEGFQALPAVMTLLERVTGRAWSLEEPPAPREVLNPDERIATREVAEACGISVESAQESLQEMVDADEAERERHPRGHVWRLVE